MAPNPDFFNIMYTRCWGKCTCCRNNCINATMGKFWRDNV